MIYNDCRDCALYRGNCGHHFIDLIGHINYTRPTESRMDDAIGPHGICFTPSEQYSLETKKEIIEEITKNYSVEMIRLALKKMEKERNTTLKPNTNDAIPKFREGMELKNS